MFRSFDAFRSARPYRTAFLAASIAASVSACKGDDAPPAGKPAEAAAAPAAPGPHALAPLGLTIDVPAGAKVEDTSVDAPAVTIESPGCRVMVSTATEAYASDFDAAKSEVQKDPNPFKQFTKEEKAQGGWHLEYELASALDKSPSTA